MLAFEALNIKLNRDRKNRKEVFWQAIVNGVIAGSAYELVAIGFDLIFQVCRFFHLSHGAVFTAAKGKRRHSPLLYYLLVSGKNFPEIFQDETPGVGP